MLSLDACMAREAMRCVADPIAARLREAGITIKNTARNNSANLNQTAHFNARTTVCETENSAQNDIPRNRLPSARRPVRQRGTSQSEKACQRGSDSRAH